MLPDIKKSVIDSWEDSLKSVDLFFFSIIDACVDDIENVLMLKILYFINEENRLTKYDEKIFEYYKKLMWYYYETINMFKINSGHINDDKILEILNGICSVLVSQIKQFEEFSQQEYNISNIKDALNPIKKEKEDIVDNTRSYLHELLSEIKNLAYDEIPKSTVRHNCFSSIDKNQYDAYVNSVDAVYGSIRNSMGHNLYSAYCDSVNECFAKINNMQLRKATKFYYDAINEEKETLSSIIKFQVEALEALIRGKSPTAEEEQAVQQILGVLREGHQRLGREIEELVMFFKESQVSANANFPANFPIEEINETILTDGKNKYIESLKQGDSFEGWIEETVIDYNIGYTIFTDLYLSLIKDELKENQNLEFIVEIKTDLKDKIRLGEEMIYMFGEIFRYFASNKEELSKDALHEVVFGINETTEIKIESIKENTVAFKKKTDEKLKEFLEEIEELEKQEIEIAVEELQANWIFNMCSKDFNNDEILEYIELEISNIYQNENYKTLKEKNSRNTQKTKEKFFKDIRDFLKDHLLYEMMTFEEIINFSIFKIKTDSEDENTAAFKYGKLCEDTYSDLTELLGKYNIEKITPNLHELFNGKEHEVLLAEQKDDFAKGEIVKLINSGYKHKDVVVIRANVIAAK